MIDVEVIDDKFAVLSYALVGFGFVVTCVWRHVVDRFFIANKWCFDLINNNSIVDYLMRLSYKISFKLIDRGFIEMFGSTGLSRLFQESSKNYSFIQTGYIYHYILIVISSISFVLILYSFDIMLGLLLLMFEFLVAGQDIEKEK